MRPTIYNLLITIFCVLNFSLLTAAQFCPGCLDPSFNGTGKQVVALGSSPGQRGMVLQSDGSIVSLIQGYDYGRLLRLNTVGSLDTTFGGTGIVDIGWGYSATLPSGYPFGIAKQVINGEEKFVVVGSWTVSTGKKSSKQYLRVDRYNNNGTRDASFGANGTLLVDKPYALAIAIQPDDQKIVMVGEYEAVVRLNANGTLDPSFGSNGSAATGAGQQGYSLLALPASKGGGILIGGSYASGNSSLFCVTKLKANGALDATFGSTGRIAINFFGRGSFGRVNNIAVDSFDNVIAAGHGNGGTNVNDMLVARLTPNGILDTSFNGTGKAAYDSGLNDAANGVSIGPVDGSIYINGSVQLGTNNYDVALVKFSFNGSRDPAFGSNGVVLTDIGGPQEGSKTSALWVDPACVCEKLIIAGSSSQGATFARYYTSY